MKREFEWPPPTLRICKNCLHCDDQDDISLTWECRVSPIEGQHCNYVTGKGGLMFCYQVNTDGQCDKWESNCIVPARCSDPLLRETYISGSDFGLPQMAGWVKKHVFKRAGGKR